MCSHTFSYNSTIPPTHCPLCGAPLTPPACPMHPWRPMHPAYPQYPAPYPYPYFPPYQIWC